jgi:hypothetical protein
VGAPPWWSELRCSSTPLLPRGILFPGLVYRLGDVFCLAVHFKRVKRMVRISVEIERENREYDIMHGVFSIDGVVSSDGFYEGFNGLTWAFCLMLAYNDAVKDKQVELTYFTGTESQYREIQGLVKKHNDKHH